MQWGILLGYQPLNYCLHFQLSMRSASNEKIQIYPGYNYKFVNLLIDFNVLVKRY